MLQARSDDRPIPREPLARATGEAPSPLTALGDGLRLDSFDLDALLVALAPDLDHQYEDVFAALQGDRLAVRPTPRFLLDLLCTSPGERLALRSRLMAGAPLVRLEVLRLVSNAAGRLLVEPDPRILDAVLGEYGLDPRLESVARLIVPRLGLDVDDAYAALLGELDADSLLFLRGDREAGTLETAEALAGRVERSLLLVDVQAAIDRGLDIERTILIAARDASLLDAVLCFANLDRLDAGQVGRLTAWRLAYHAAPLATGVSERLLDDVAGIRVVVLPVAMPGPHERQRAWERALVDVPGDADLATLASRFRLGPAQIERAVDEARTLARLRAEEGGEARLCGADLFAGARARTGHELAALARRIESVFGWDDIVLPEDSLAQLREICSRVAHRDLVVDDWGFRRALGIGLGVSALFAGSSGTGKTMAAGVLANELELDLYAIDLASIVSKYIGETSKNLDRVFRAAEDANAILFFDEAEALFGKRSEVRDSHDRYANVEIAYLLQKMEAYDGVAVLATNLRQNLDEAFARRLGFTVHFPFPSATDRLEIWRRVWPDEVPLAADVDLDELAERFRLSGGNIRNAALASAFLAAAKRSEVRREHLLLAVRREYQKLGRGLSAEELDGADVELAEAIA
jgi:hypothetical protein